MDWKEFEEEVCKLLFKHGFWALNIPRSRGGSQPFDVIAIRKERVLAFDCKVLSRGNRFPIGRIEDNQWLAFEAVDNRTYANTGVLVYSKSGLHFIQYKEIKEAFDNGESSIVLTENHRKLWEVLCK